MTELRRWLIFCGAVVLTVLLAAVVLALSGRPDLALVASRLAMALSAIGLLFAALMAGIIVWGEVRTGRSVGQRSTKTLHGNPPVMTAPVRRVKGIR